MTERTKRIWRRPEVTAVTVANSRADERDVSIVNDIIPASQFT